MEGVHHQGNGDGAFAATYKLSTDPDPANGDAPKLTGSQLAVNAYNNTYITITAPPKNVAAAPGANATFTVTASSGYLGDPPGVAPPPISYQWQTALFGAGSFTSLSNATTNSYTTPALTSGDDGSRFRVTLATAGLSISSTSATLTVGTLKFTRVSASLGLVTLQWSGNAVLEQAPSLTGPWTPSANQNNPQTSPVFGTSFYRLRQ
jgi:hypothetical protein